jgi:nicotinate-nucleotide adenylyltransferase
MTAPLDVSTSSKIDVALFGGAFDPITFGHMAVMMGVHSQTGFPVWVMPCYQHMFGKEMATPAQRFLMCGYACAALGTDDFIPFRFEIDQKHNGSTYDLLKVLKKEYTDHTFHLVIGTDNISTILTKWDRGALLIKENPIIIADRPGFEKADLAQAHPLSRHITVGFPSASSNVREAIANKDYPKAKRQVFWKVWQEIENQQIYGHTGLLED